MRFKDRVVVVTGGSLGIGWAAAAAFAGEGANVAIVSSDPQRGRSAARTLEQAGHEAGFVQADVSSERDVEGAVGEIASRWGRIDVLVNNAGIHRQGTALETSLEEWQSVLAVNLTGAFLFTRHAVPLMIEGGGGVVVNVSSEAGLVGIAGQVAYNVSKAGMISLTKSCAVDFANHGVRANCVCPGTTDTPLVDGAVARAADPAAARRKLESIRPLDRLGTAEEVASAILYLSSPEAAYATGAVLAVDGGYTSQ